MFNLNEPFIHSQLPYHLDPGAACGMLVAFLQEHVAFQ